MNDLCSVENCANEAKIVGFCNFHRKREIEGRLVHLDGLLYDTCGEGHLLTVENTRWEPTGKGGKKRRRCRMCLSLRAAAKKLQPVEVIPPDPWRPDDPVMTRAIDTFEKAIVLVEPKCRGQEDLYRDYTADEIPGKAEAKDLCAGCPLLKMCDNYAAVTEPGWGVWGGRAWVYGQTYLPSKRNMLHIDD